MGKTKKVIMQELFTLGDIYVSDFISDGEDPRAGTEPLKMMFEKSTGAVRLESATNPDVMYGKYWYRSGINTTMTNELKGIAEKLPTMIPVQAGDIFLDIACNDGTLLSHVPDKMLKVGIDPADDTFVVESREHADVVQDYFSANAYRRTQCGYKQAKIITVIAMFYDVVDPVIFLEDVHDIMDDEGLLVIQLSYTPLMLRQLAFDNICHEHVYYYSLTSMMNLLDRTGFRVVDCELNDINGGSIRIYIRKNTADITNFKTAPYRDVANYRIDSILSQERIENVCTPAPYLQFYDDICKLRDETVAFIRKVKAEGKTIWGYGASTKGNTLLQWYGLDHTLIDGIAERSPAKFGLKTIATNIPIYSEAHMRAVNPDYMLVLPWHFIDEFVKREHEYLASGGKFIVPCPKFAIIAAPQ